MWDATELMNNRFGAIKFDKKLDDFEMSFEIRKEIQCAN